MKRVFSALLLTFASSVAYSQVSQNVYNFLRLPVSAHAAALGGDNITIIEDDASLMFHNPALLSSVSSKTIGLNYMNYMSGASVASASYNQSSDDRATWAASGQYIDYGKMKETDENNNILGEFSAKDISLAGYFSYMLTDKIAGGIAARFITSYIGDYNSIAAGIDLGINYYDANTGWSASVLAKNLGGQLKAYNEDYEKMPLDIQIGVSKRLTGTPLQFSATLVDLNHTDYKFINHWVFGAEAILSDAVWIGAGYNLRRANEMKISNGEDASSHGAGLAFGAGINLDRFCLNIGYGKYHVSNSSILLNLAYKL